MATGSEVLAAGSVGLAAWATRRASRVQELAGWAVGASTSSSLAPFSSHPLPSVSYRGKGLLPTLRSRTSRWAGSRGKGIALVPSSDLILAVPPRSPSPTNARRLCICKKACPIRSVPQSQIWRVPCWSAFHGSIFCDIWRFRYFFDIQLVHIGSR